MDANEAVRQLLEQMVAETDEIGLQVAGEYRTYLARSRQGEIAKGARVKVVENLGGELVVEPERS